MGAGYYFLRIFLLRRFLLPILRRPLRGRFLCGCGILCSFQVAIPAGLEPATSKVEAWRSIQLSYGTKMVESEGVAPTEAK